MEEIVAIVFENELKAIEAFKILRRLDGENLITMYEAQVISKGSGGAVRIVENNDTMSFPLIFGASTVGALVGILGGPLGVVGGASLGGLLGSIGDLKEEGVTEKFVDDVKLAMAPDTSVVVADLDEWVPCLDSKMKQIGGVMFRRSRDIVEAAQREVDAAEHRAEERRLSAEEADVRAQDRATLDAKADRFRTHLQEAIRRGRTYLKLRQQQREAKIKLLEAKAKQAKGEILQSQQARIEELRRDYSARASQAEAVLYGPEKTT